jgi:hypothetical protein
MKKDRAPVWVPRNGEYYVITCTDCLRSFSIPAEKSVRVLRELRTLACIFCDAPGSIHRRRTARSSGASDHQNESYSMKHMEVGSPIARPARIETMESRSAPCVAD